jgi:hypothetical protein
MEVMIRRKPFPRLRHVGVGQIFGGADSLWKTIAPKPHVIDNRLWDNQAQLIGTCRVCTLMVLRLTSITHFCQRSPSGPFSLPHVFYWTDRTEKRIHTAPLFNIHYDSIHQSIPAALGHPTRWFYEDLGYSNILDKIISRTECGIYQAQDARRAFEGTIASVQRFPHTNLQLEIYASADHRWPAGFDPDSVAPMRPTHSDIKIGPEFEREYVDEVVVKDGAKWGMQRRKGKDDL